MKPKLKKRKQIEELDPFAAALRAADDIKITKPKRLKPKQDILDGLQHSLNDSSTLRPFMSIEATSSVKEGNNSWLQHNYPFVFREIASKL